MTETTCTCGRIAGAHWPDCALVAQVARIYDIPTELVAGRVGPECVTRAEREIASPDYLAVCTGIADLIATSLHCPGETDAGTCGGHAICRPCFDLGVERGLIEPEALP